MNADERAEAAYELRRLADKLERECEGPVFSAAHTHRQGNIRLSILVEIEAHTQVEAKHETTD